MLDLNKSQLIETRVAQLSSTVSLVEEGSAMVHFLENGVGVVKPSTGSGTEAFAGFAISRSTIPNIVPYYESLVVAATSPYTITLSKTMSGNDISVVLVSGGTRTPLTVGTPASNATEYSISNGVITVHSSQASKTIEVGYNTAISLAEARMRYEINEFAPGSTALDTIGLCPTGEVFISNFDITSNWAGWTPGTAIKLGASGKITLGGSGTAIPVVVTSVPGVSSPFLGVRANMGN